MEARQKLLDTIVVPLFSKAIRETPHRDLCFGKSYSWWLRNYIQALTIAKSLDLSSDSSTKEMLVGEVKMIINSILLSSAGGRKWSEVSAPLEVGDVSAWRETPSGAENNAGGGYQGNWWESSSFYRGNRSFLATGSPVGNSSSSSSVYLCTDRFLQEPLLGGKWIQEWNEACRSSPLKKDVGGHHHHSVVVPFSSLFELKEKAFLRPSIAHESKTTAGTSASSLQERTAMQKTIQALFQNYQLQFDVEKINSGGAGENVNRVYVWTPTDEFDSICEISQIRALLSLAHSGNTNEKQPNVGSHHWLQLKYVCEDYRTRMTFFTRYLASKVSVHADKQKQQEQGKGESGHSSVALVAPTEMHKRYRDLGVTGALISTVPSGKGDGGGSSTSGNYWQHREAMKECEALAKKLTKREENMRQMFSQHL